MFPKGQGGKILQVRKLKPRGSQNNMPKVMQRMRAGLDSATEPAVFILNIGRFLCKFTASGYSVP